MVKKKTKEKKYYNGKTMTSINNSYYQKYVIDQTIL